LHQNQRNLSILNSSTVYNFGIQAIIHHHGWKKCLIPTSKDPLHQKPKTAHTAKMGKTYLKSERDYVIDKFK